MPDIEVHIDRPGRVQRVGTLHRQARRGGEAVAFEYHADWLADPDRFSLEPALTLNRGALAPAAGLVSGAGMLALTVSRRTCRRFMSSASLASIFSRSLLLTMEPLPS